MAQARASTLVGEEVQLRPPSVVMRLHRMGSFHQTRISFMRSLLRRIAAEGWQLTHPIWDLDAHGYGTVVYRVETPGGVCSLVAFSHELKPEERSDRVIAEKWDATFALTLREPTAFDIERLRANVPKQETGRCSPNEAVLSRANRSVRLFQYVVDCLADGRQPSLEEVVRIGYLMRTTAVYGNGKFGISDLPHTFGSGLFRRPFEAEMLSVFLTREFSIDLVEHIARMRSPERAVRLDPQVRHALGIGNSTGLGMAPFLVAHPTLFHRWVLARETAIARVRAQLSAPQVKRDAFLRLLDQSIAHVDEWETEDERQAARIVVLGSELRALSRLVKENDDILDGKLPWQTLTDRVAEAYSEETEELVNSLIVEPHGELVDDLADEMVDPESECLDPTMTLGELRELITQHYGWVLDIDFSQPEAQHFFWYRSEEKEEPRLGERFNEPGADREMRLAIARDVQALERVLASDTIDSGERVAVFLLREPQWRFIVSRIQLTARYPYGEIQDNLLASDCVPIDLLRCKLAFFGASKFDPKSDRWTRIAMYQGAPFFAELANCDPNGWAFPVFLSHAGRRSREQRADRELAESRSEHARPTDWGLRQQDPGISDLAEGARSNVARHSMNEIYRICQKAVEGSGAPGGTDIEVAKAAVWLTAHGFPVLEDLAVELERTAVAKGDLRVEVEASDDGPARTVDAVGRSGALLATFLVDLLPATSADADGVPRLRVSNLSSPLFLAAAAQRHIPTGWNFHFDVLEAESGQRFAVRATSDSRVQILGAEGSSVFGRLMANPTFTVEAVCARSQDALPSLDGQGLAILRDGDSLAAAEQRSLARGIDVDPATWRRLWSLAKNVLVPGTEESRLRGAGSTMNDSE